MITDDGKKPTAEMPLETSSFFASNVRGATPVTNLNASGVIPTINPQKEMKYNRTIINNSNSGTYFGANTVYGIYIPDANAPFLDGYEYDGTYTPYETPKYLSLSGMILFTKIFGNGVKFSIRLYRVVRNSITGNQCYLEIYPSSRPMLTPDNMERGRPDIINFNYLNMTKIPDLPANHTSLGFAIAIYPEEDFSAGNNFYLGSQEYDPAEIPTTLTNYFCGEFDKTMLNSTGGMVPFYSLVAPKFVFFGIGTFENLDNSNKLVDRFGNSFEMQTTVVNGVHYDNSSDVITLRMNPNRNTHLVKNLFIDKTKQVDTTLLSGITLGEKLAGPGPWPVPYYTYFIWEFDSFRNGNLLFKFNGAGGGGFSININIYGLADLPSMYDVYNWIAATHTWQTIAPVVLFHADADLYSIANMGPTSSTNQLNLTFTGPHRYIVAKFENADAAPGHIAKFDNLILLGV